MGHFLYTQIYRTKSAKMEGVFYEIQFTVFC